MKWLKYGLCSRQLCMCLVIWQMLQSVMIGCMGYGVDGSWPVKPQLQLTVWIYQNKRQKLHMISSTSVVSHPYICALNSLFWIPSLCCETPMSSRTHRVFSVSRHCMSSRFQRWNNSLHFKCSREPSLACWNNRDESDRRQWAHPQQEDEETDDTRGK